MKIKVTKHAIERYRERTFNQYLNDQEVERILRDIASSGKQVRSRFIGSGNCMEVMGKGIFIVLVHEGNLATVITCLGDEKYRRWVKSQDSFLRLPGRLIYPA